MYSLSFQYVKELDSDKSEAVMNNGIEPIVFPLCNGTLCHWASHLFFKRLKSSSPAQIWTADPYIISVVL